jgi:hypothetical protein
MIDFKITYNHAEAYCHMQYACPEGHVVEIWNSRDGVTPFMVQCLRPDCDAISQHVCWNEDREDPTYQLQPGDWYFRNGKTEDAERVLRYRLEGRPLDVDFLARMGATSVEDLIQKLIQYPHGEFGPGWPYLDRFQPAEAI